MERHFMELKNTFVIDMYYNFDSVYLFNIIPNELFFYLKKGLEIKQIIHILNTKYENKILITKIKKTNER